MKKLPENQKTAIGRRIELVRKDSGLRKGAFAEALGIKRKHLYLCLQGRTTFGFTTLMTFLNTYGVNPLWLWSGKGNRYIARK